MASSSWCLSATCSPSALLPLPSRQAQATAGSLGSVVLSRCGRVLFPPSPRLLVRSRRRGHGVVCMAPEEERATRRSPRDFPIEWERPKPGRRPDIFPKFSPMKTPLPIPMPSDPAFEDDQEDVEEEEEEEKKTKEEEEEEDPEDL